MTGDTAYDIMINYPIKFNQVLSIALGTVTPTSDIGGTILNYAATQHGLTGSAYRMMYTASITTNRNPLGFHLTVGQ